MLDAAGQMAADLALLESVVAGGPPALRLYPWNPPALSLGRFQPETDVDHAACRRLGVEAAVARHDGPGGAVCLATQQGADLRVGDRKVCGSAQVRRDGVVLQHGSVLLDRLDFDETDLVAGDHDRAALRASTVTLAELGAPTDPRRVAAALVEGFRAELDVDVTPSLDLDHGI